MPDPCGQAANHSMRGIRRSSRGLLRRPKTSPPERRPGHSLRCLHRAALVRLPRVGAIRVEEEARSLPRCRWCFHVSGHGGASLPTWYYSLLARDWREYGVKHLLHARRRPRVCLRVCPAAKMPELVMNRLIRPLTAMLLILHDMSASPPRAATTIY